MTCGRCGLSGRVDGPATAKTADPWTFTVDLRKLAPKNWGKGTRAFMLVSMLVVVFFAGGVSGMVFERATDAVNQDLSGLGSFGSGNEGVQSEVDTAVEPEGATVVPASPPPAAPPTSPTPPSTPPGRETTLLFSKTGTDDKTFSTPAQTPAGLYRLDMQYFGADHFFALKVSDADDALLLRVDGQKAGDYQGSRYVGLGGGVHKITVGSSTQWQGDWAMQATFIGDEKGAEPAWSKAGVGDQGQGPVEAPGQFDLTFSASSGMVGQVAVTAWTARGVAVPDCSLTGDTSKSSPMQETISCTATGTIYFDVRAPAPFSASNSDGWTLSMKA